MRNHPSSTLSVNILGPGRLGIALAIALSKRGYQIRSLIGRRASKVRRAASVLDVPAALLVTKNIELMPEADLLIIATPDDQILSVVETLTPLNIKKGHGPVALHTSGALSSELLTPLSKQGWSVGSMHPLVSVSDPSEGAMSFGGSYWCVEGDTKAIRLAKRIVRDFDGRSFAIAATDKPLYHAAAVMASGNVVAVFDTAIDMLSRCGLSRRESQRVLLPLLKSTCANLDNRGPSEALTGTFSRGDVDTVERHLNALAGKDLEKARTLYRLLGEKSLQLAEAKGLDREVSRRILKKLAK